MREKERRKKTIDRKSADEQHQCTKRKTYFEQNKLEKVQTRKMSNEWAEL